MDIMMITNRAISNDRFFEKRKELQYQMHVKRVEQIMKYKQQKLRTLQNQNQKITKVIKKARQSAKAFQQNEKKKALKIQNKILVEKLWKISQNGTNITKYNKNDESNIKISHQAEYRRKISQKILYQNKFIAKNIMDQSRNKKSKSQIKEQMKEYLALREGLRKIKNTQNSNQLGKSQRKILPRTISETKKLIDQTVHLYEQSIQKQVKNPQNLKTQS